MGVIMVLTGLAIEIMMDFQTYKIR